MYFNDRPIMQPFNTSPSAYADISGDTAHTALRGRVYFYPHLNGTTVLSELSGLPYDSAPCAENVYAMHIHESGDCSTRKAPAFTGAGGHYNPSNCPHPAHAGDLPPLFSNNGYAWQGFYTDRFIPKDVIGKSVVIHSQRDDFTTQPAGDAGERIGCGGIKPWLPHRE